MRIISVIGYKKTGKTSLIERLVKAFRNYGTVGTVKHLHETEIDTSHSDTWKHARAGADIVIGVTPSELVKFSKKNDLSYALEELAAEGIDVCVVEGFKESTLPKIALGEVEASNILLRLEKVEAANIDEIVSIVLKLPEFHTLDSLIRKIKNSKDIEKAGAIGTFTGIVRAASGDTRTEFLEFEEYGDVAHQKMDEICRDLKEKEGIIEVLMHHRTGFIQAGEDIVYVLVAAGHREELFPALREAIERLKAEVPIWKKEHTLSGEWWVHDGK